MRPVVLERGEEFLAFSDTVLQLLFKQFFCLITVGKELPRSLGSKVIREFLVYARRGKSGRCQQIPCEIQRFRFLDRASAGSDSIDL
jgi:hypothetical protein